MSITIKCPVTGSAFRLPNFGTNEHIVSAPHPLLCITITQLSKLSLPESHADRHILLCAWLEQLSQTGICRWTGTINPANFSQRWHEQQFEQLKDLISWLIHNSNHPAHSVIPQLNLNHDLNSENLQTWREESQAIIGSYVTYFDSSESRRLRAAQEAAALILDSKLDEDSTHIRRAKTRRNYVSNSLAFHENQVAVDLVLKVLAKPYDFELMTLQQVKSFCMDFLPETDHENYNDKMEVLQLLDAAILDRIGMAQFLGLSTTVQDNEQAKILSQYTAQVDDQIFITTTNQKLSTAINSLTKQTLHDAPTSAAITFASEPKLEDYKHRLGYDIAMRNWAKQQLAHPELPANSYFNTIKELK